MDGLKKISKALNGNESTLGKLTGQAADLLGSLKHDSITGTGINYLGDVLSAALIKLNLKTDQMDANTFMQMYHIKNLDTSKSSIINDGNQEGNSGKVLIVVRYTIELPIFKFFNLEIKKGIDCVNFSYTEVWG